MIYKNSIKLIFSNFALVWKLLVYLMVCILFVGFLNHIISAPILQDLGITQVLTRIPDAIKEFFASFEFSTLLMEIKESFTLLIECIYDGFAVFWWKYLILGMVGLFLPYFTISFFMLSTCNVLHYYMGSCLNFGFTGSLFVNFWKNVRLTLFNTFVILPIRIFTFLLCIKLFVVLFKANWVLKIFAPFIFMVVFILLSSIRLTLSCGCVPHMVVKNAKLSNSIVGGITYTKKIIVKIFANALGVVLTIVVINFCSIFTFGVSLFITIPASLLLVSVFNMVSFYTATGLRFYVDNNNVFVPKKSEMEENFKIYKNII